MHARSFDEAGDVLSPADFAEIAGLHKQTVYALCKSGVIPCRKAGNHWLISKRSLLRWLEGGEGDALPDIEQV